MIGLMTDHERALAANGGMHARLAQGLREAADYISAHPDLPIPSSVEIHYCIPASTDQGGEDEAYRIAAIIGAKVTGDDDGSSSEAGRDFGTAVSYRAVYLTRDRMAAYYATQAAAQEARDAA